MSNRQQPWDDMLIRDRVSPRELDDHDKEQMEQQESQQEPLDNKDRVLDSNHDTHSKKD